MADLMFTGILGKVFRSFFWLFGRMMFSSADSLSDGIIELEAEDRFDFKDWLTEIKIPTLVIGGGKDFLYLIRETAAGIPGAKLIIYEGAGHGAMMKRQFSIDILDFLNEPVN